MTKREQMMAEKLGLTEKDFQPVDKVGNLSETVDDIILTLADIIGGEEL